MKKSHRAVAAALLAPLFVGIAPLSAETLHYTINWQSGLSLGEAALQTSKGGSKPAPAPVPASDSGSAAAPLATPPPPPPPPSKPTPEGGWNFQLTLDAAVPGFMIRDEYKSRTDAKFCSQEFERTVQRGSKKSSERSTFDQDKRTVKRITEFEGGLKGGISDMDTVECAHDALGFLQFMRNELAQGRLVAHQPVYFGGKYDLQVNYIGNDIVKLGDKRIEADMIRVNSHGLKSDFEVDIYFSKDENRTPLMARIPLSLGTFTVELMR